MLLQLNGELPNRFPNHERRLYIFICKQKACRRKKGSARVFRCVRLSEIGAGNTERAQPTAKAEITPDTSKKEVSTLGETLFGAKPISPSLKNTNPFSTSATSSSPFNPFSTSSLSNRQNSRDKIVPLTADSSPEPQNASDILPTFAEKLSLGSTDQSTSVSSPKAIELWPNLDQFPPGYPRYFLDADFEVLETESTAPVPHSIEIDEAATGSRQRGEDKEIFESSIDRTFQSFADRLAQNPEQVLRYEFGGTPLLYSSQDSIGQIFSKPHSNSSRVITTQSSTSKIPRCVNCGSARVFELQLTPHAILELEVEEPGLEGMEWGTIIMGVCSKDCLPNGLGTQTVGYLEEWIGVQWEEPGSKT